MFTHPANDKMVQGSLEAQFEHEALVRAGMKGLPCNFREAINDFFYTAFINILKACR